MACETVKSGLKFIKISLVRSKPFHPCVSEVGSSTFELGHIHCGKWGCKLKFKNRNATSVDPDETAHMSRLIRIYTVCISSYFVRLAPVFSDKIIFHTICLIIH